MKINEVAPPGWGHTKAEKEKTDPSKPKSKIGGTAAAFDRARKEGRFKGRKSDMFAIMWSQKNKGDKPHYKPGTDKKYKKYQEGFSDWRTELVEKDLNAAERRSLPDKDFVFPGKGEGPEGKQRGAYPIPDKKHARAALAMSAAHASPAKQAKVKAAVEKKFPGIEVSEEHLNELVGGAGTLVRQGVKIGGKKGGRAVQAGQSAAIKAGQGAKVKAAQGNQSKMIGTGRAEKIGAVAGGLAGGVALGALDGPVPVGDIVGGIAGSKIGGKIGRQVDKAGSAVKKAVVGEGVLADRLKKITKEKKDKWDREGNKAKKDAYKALDDVKSTQAAMDKELGEGIVDKVVKHYRDKKKPKKHQYPGRDAGKLAKDRLADKEHNKYVNFLPAEKD